MTLQKKMFWVAFATLIVAIIGIIIKSNSSVNKTSKITTRDVQGPVLSAHDTQNLTINYNVPDTSTKEAIREFEKILSQTNEKVELTRNEIRLLSQALKDLDQKTSGIEKLPDGRSRVGHIITGEPLIVITEHNASIEDFNARDYKSSLIHSQNAIKAYEDTQKIPRRMSTGDLLPESVSKIYMLGATVAQQLEKTDLAYQYAKKSVEISSNSKNNALLATVLYNSKKYPEALDYINRALQGESSNSKFIILKNMILLQYNPDVSQVNQGTATKK